MAKNIDYRKFMELALEAMKKSISEPRNDGKASPKVGVVLVSVNGTFLGSSFRGEMRNGDHAEYTLLDRKFRDKDVTGCYLFATLEPCAPGSRKHPKLGCAERIVNARIKKVWVGIEDPDPTVDRKGIKYLQDSGIEVEMFEEEFQEIIYKDNKEFIKQAKQRKEEAKKPKVVQLSPLERPIETTTIDEFSDEALKRYIDRANLKMNHDSHEFLSQLEEQQLIQYDTTSEKYKPTGLGILLFGKNPRNRYPQAVLKVEARYGKEEPEILDFSDALVLIPDKVEEWLKRVLSSRINRQKFARKTEYSYPLEVLREAIINALVHRDYDIAGAKCYVNIDNDKIVVKSPGLPVSPIKLEDFKQFKAPSLSRNPKLMAVFNAMHYAEERGIGMIEMKSLPEKHNLPLPNISWEEPFINISFPRTQNYFESLVGSDVFNQLKEEEKNGLVFIHNKKEVTKAQYAKHFGFNDKKAQRHLLKFKKLQLVGTKGQSTATKYIFNENR
jgi:ATP-dependent DNA helicase RecG